ncbi:hypothetical protein [Streptomyces virginiae]|uniref:hypothetical protein n=1 Tax=Streptomyces virginiae TaxID=1961 RepID=UPI0036596D26
MSAHTPTGRPVLEPAERIPALAALRSAVRRRDRAAVFFSGLLTVACAYPWIEYLRERRRGEG